MSRARFVFGLVFGIEVLLALAGPQGRALAQQVAVGSEFQVNTYTDGTGVDGQRYAALACDSDGAFVVAWQGPSTTGYGYTVFHQRYDSGGVPLGSEAELPGGSCMEREVPQACRDGAGNAVIVGRGG